MSAPFTIDRCRRCGYLAFPPRILCPTCAGTDWGRCLADRGIVEEVTVRRPVFKRRQLPWGNWLDQEAVSLATVRTDAGPTIVTRVAAGTRPGDRVRLAAQGSTAIGVGGHDLEGTAVADAQAASTGPGD